MIVSSPARSTPADAARPVLEYSSGFGNLHSSEALPGALPQGQNSPQRLPFDLERIMRTGYQIDRYQDRYFVIDSFEQLLRETAPDFTPIYAHIRSSENRP